MSDLTKEEMWVSCANRSEEEEECGEFSCCSDARHMGYICWRRNIEDVKPKHCKDCKFYEQK